MSEEAGPDEGSTAQPGDEIAPSSPHADIVERLLEYQRRLREESDMAAPIPEGMPTTPLSPPAGRIPVESGPRERAGSEPEPQPMPEPRWEPDAESGQEPEARAEMEPRPEGSTQMEPEPEAEARPASTASPEPSARPDIRQLRERIERLDETLARIAAMLPLLRGDDRDREP